MSLLPAVVLSMGVLPAGAGATPVAEADQQILDRYLRNLAAVSRLYQDIALSFSCEEKIHYHTNYGRKTYRSFYVYRYDEAEGLSDFRMRYRFNPRKTFKPKDVVDLGDFPLPVSLSRAYSWIFIFGSGAREHYRYELSGRGEVLGRPAVQIRFEGIPPYVQTVNDWIGTAWVDAESFQLLRVEAYRPGEYREKLSLDRAREELQRAEEKLAPKSYSVEVVTTEFEVEKNGMRFPSEVRIERRSYLVPGDARLGKRRYLVRQKYINYSFFNVRTETEIEAMVD
jgi:hypothetical protein